MDFSKEEFDIMVEELLYREPVSFDMLCTLADKTVRSRVKGWCLTEDALKGRSYEEDIMQEIYIRLMKTTVTRFLLKDGVDGPVNNDPQGFSYWMITVAKNLKRDFANRVRGVDRKTENFDRIGIESKLIHQKKEPDDENLQEFREAFSIVLSSEVKIYKILTWLAQFVFVAGYDVTKIRSNEMMLALFEKKTLFEMYLMLRNYIKRVDWVEISPAQNEKIIKDLQEPWDMNRMYGDVEFCEFFMKANGEKSGKKSISDWMNRMSSMLNRKMKRTAIETSGNHGEGKE